MFLLVEFTESKTVNIVLEDWFEDGTTKWPNYKSDGRINRAIMKREEPGEDWKEYDVRVLSKSGKDILKIFSTALVTKVSNQFQSCKQQHLEFQLLCCLKR